MRAPDWRRLVGLSPRSSTPLARRFVSTMVAAVALAMVVVGLAAWFTARWSLYSQIDRDLTRTANAQAYLISADPSTMGGQTAADLEAANLLVTLVNSDGTVLPVPGQTLIPDAGAPELAVARTQSGTSLRSVTLADGTRYRQLAVPLTIGDKAYALVVARPTTAIQSALTQLLVVLVLAAAFGVAVTALVGWSVARSTLAPVRYLSTAVRHVTATDDLTPIQVLTNDDLGDLTRSFNTMLNSLASSRERQRRLIADAGHELRTPLTSIRTNIELLLADDKTGMLPPGARSEILADIAAQLGEFTSLVGDLVQLSRDDRVNSAPEPLDFREVVQNAVGRARRRGPNLHFDVELDPLAIVGEADSLERAITNLLDNAVKFSPPGGTIRVHLEGDQLRISDQGPGIADEDLPHVFDRFYRSDRARNTPGTGLGLSIVAHTINAHGGWVRAGRAAEGGAEFIVRVPGTTPTSEPEPEPQRASETVS